MTRGAKKKLVEAGVAPLPDPEPEPKRVRRQRVLALHTARVRSASLTECRVKRVVPAAVCRPEVAHHARRGCTLGSRRSAGRSSGIGGHRWAGSSRGE